MLHDEMESGLKTCENYTLMIADESWWNLWRRNKVTMKTKGYAVTKVNGMYYVLKPTSVKDVKTLV